LSDWLLTSDHVEVGVHRVGGHLGPVRFRHGSLVFEPLHRAPWLDEPGGVEPPMLRNLQGDFFCAPFGANDLRAEEQRDHGLTANGAWRLREQSGNRVLLELEGRVSGAIVTKEVFLHPREPVVYQLHRFDGGTGALPMGHHAMLRAPEGEALRLSFSRWAWAGTPPEPVESDPARGRSLLRYPQRIDSLASTLTATGEAVDLSRYPTLEASEEILMLVTHPDQQLGWSAAVAPKSGWVWFALRPNTVLRATLLWLSNGGRDYPPFLGRHRRVLGIEELTSYFHLGHRASAGPNALNSAGVPTAVSLRPDLAVTTRYAFGCIPAPAGFGRVASLALHGDELTLSDHDGREARVDFDASFMASPDPLNAVAGSSNRSGQSGRR
jgi:hypothetical protein